MLRSSPSRLLAVHVRHPDLGLVVLYSIYLDVEGGVTGPNKDHLLALYMHSAGHGLPWLCMGDWNNQPDVVAESEWFSRHRLKLLVPDGPTCWPQGDGKGSGSLIDYLVVKRGFAEQLRVKPFTLEP